MEFREALKDFPSAAGKELYAREICRSREAFGEVLKLALYDPDPVGWRAAWILDAGDEISPGLAESSLPGILRRLPDLRSNSSLRSLLRMITRYEIGEEYQGMLIDLCFGYMTSELYPVAVKVHAMQIIYNHVLIYPELKEELETVIQDQMHNNTVGFGSRGRRIIRQLQKLEL